MTIREVTYRTVRGWARSSGREGSPIADWPGTRWFTIDGVGCAALQLVRLNVYRVRGVYIDPAFRRRGLGTTITEAVLMDALEAGAHEVQAWTKNPGWYVKRGFTAQSNPGTGMVRCVWRKL